MYLTSLTTLIKWIKTPITCCQFTRIFTLISGICQTSAAEPVRDHCMKNYNHDPSNQTGCPPGKDKDQIDRGDRYAMMIGFCQADYVGNRWFYYFNR